MRIIVNNKEFKGITRYSVNQKYNAIASSFDIISNRILFEYALEYPECEIYGVDDKLLLTGTMFAPKEIEKTTPKTYTYSGYSLPGILEDVTIPKSVYPLQFDNLSLFDITEKLLNPFNIYFNIQGDILDDLNKKYTKLTAEPGVKIKQFLNELASQRNIYMSNTLTGEILYTRYDPKKFLSVAFFEEGKPGLKKINLNINSQQLHSEITIVKQATKKNPDASEYTIDNPYVTKYRPIVKISDSGDSFDLEKAARNALSAELANIKFSLNVTEYAQPGTTIELLAPSIGLKRTIELFVEETIIKNTTTETEDYTLICVLPDVYKSGEIKNIFL